MNMKKRLIIWVVIGIFSLALLIQLIPLPGRGNNPTVVAEPNWDTSQTRTLAKRACFDCHSYETNWPWYSYIAPLSWLVYGDVMEGRSRLNFSEWDQPQIGVDEITSIIQEGEMPPAIYLPMHPTAHLTNIEKEQLVSGFMNSLP
jgi:hypothetical protein